MKKFEDWFHNKVCSKVDCKSILECDTCLIARRTSWKSALEWALSEGYRADGQGSLESIIEEELEND